MSTSLEYNNSVINRLRRSTPAKSKEIEQKDSVEEEGYLIKYIFILKGYEKIVIYLYVSS